MALFDIKMPKMNGFEFMENKENGWNPKFSFTSAFDIPSEGMKEIMPPLNGKASPIIKPVLVDDLF